MKLTRTDLKNKYLINIGKQGSIDTTLISDFNMNLSQRYQMIMAHLQDYQTQQPKTASSVAAQQYYHYPNGITKIDNVYATINGVKYPLEIVNSQTTWNIFNAIQIQPSVFPRYIFPRRDDFGIWPIPQTVYDITFSYYMRDRDLMVDDYTSETVTIDNGSTTLVGIGTTFTSSMVGRFFQITDTANPGYNWWYRVASYNTAQSLTLENSWQDTTIAVGTAYRIGQCPEIPEEGHIVLVDGVTADYYSGIRADVDTATAWNNKFWTGDMNNNDRKIGDDNIKGGLIGLVNKYADRDEHALVTRRKNVWTPASRVWGSSITP